MSIFDSIRYPIPDKDDHEVDDDDIEFIKSLPTPILTKWTEWKYSEANPHPHKNRFNKVGFAQLRKIIAEYEE